MLSNTTKTLYKLTTLCSTLFLIACGGSDNHSNENSTPTPTTPSVVYSEITGTAFAATALKDATVTAICKDKAGFTEKVTVDAQGQWQGKVDSTKFPCRLEVKADQQVYHSYMSKAGYVNLNPLTDLVIASTSTQIPTEWYKSGTDLSTDKLNTANTALPKELKQKGYDINEKTDILNGELNNETKQAIQNLLEAITNSKTIQDYQALLMLIKDGNLSQLPSKNTNQNADINLDDLPEATSLSSYGLNNNACTPFPESTELYINCNGNVLANFKNSSLVSPTGFSESGITSNPCKIYKYNENIVLQIGEQSISAQFTGQGFDQLIYRNDDNEIIVSASSEGKGDNRAMLVFRNNKLTIAKVSGYLDNDNSNVQTELYCLIDPNTQ